MPVQRDFTLSLFPFQNRNVLHQNNHQHYRRKQDRFSVNKKKKKEEFHLPYSYNLSQVQVVIVNLSNEDSSNSFIQGSAIHIDGCTDRKNKSCHSSVYPIVFQKTLKGDGEGC